MQSSKRFDLEKKCMAAAIIFSQLQCVNSTGISIPIRIMAGCFVLLVWNLLFRCNLNVSRRKTTKVSDILVGAVPCLDDRLFSSIPIVWLHVLFPLSFAQRKTHPLGLAIPGKYVVCLGIIGTWTIRRLS